MTFSRIFNQLKSTLVYVLIFLVIYFAINAYRSPTAPPQLQLNDSTDIITQSHHRPVLVYFWGSWCGVCRTISPNIQTLHAQNYPVISVAVSSGNHNDVAQYMKQHGHQFDVINDEDGSLFQTWGGQVVPSFVVIRDGQVVQSFTGFAPLWSLKLRLWLSDLPKFN